MWLASAAGWSSASCPSPRRGIDTLLDVDYNQVDLISEGLTGPLEALIHVYCANRGILLSPVHDMALVSP